MGVYWCCRLSYSGRLPYAIWDIMLELCSTMVRESGCCWSNGYQSRWWNLCMQAGILFTINTRPATTIIKFFLHSLSEPKYTCKFHKQSFLLRTAHLWNYATGLLFKMVIFKSSVSSWAILLNNPILPITTDHLTLVNPYPRVALGPP